MFMCKCSVGTAILVQTRGPPSSPLSCLWDSSIKCLGNIIQQGKHLRNQGKFSMFSKVVCSHLKSFVKFKLRDFPVDCVPFIS